MYINLSGLNILVTGASKGIGKAISTKLAEAGASIGVHYNESADDAENLAGIIGNQSRAFQADLSVDGEAAKLFERVSLEMGSVEVLVNNAGVAIASEIEENDQEWIDKWKKTLMVNLTSAAILSKKAIQYFVSKQTSGRIINIASRAAFRGDVEAYMAYAASKAGLSSLTHSIARNFGKKGIRAFNIAPGFVKTEMAQEFIKQYGEEKVKGDLSLERLTEPKDIAPLVTFIASGMADHTTGTTIDVNAGSYLH